MGRPSGGAGAAQAVPPLLSPGRLGPFGAWARRHDDSWLFVGIYIGLAIGLSLFVSLFWLVVVGVFHLVLELVRQAYYRRSRTSVFLHAWWEIKMDVGLILLAVTLVLYLEVVLGLLGLQSAARAAAATRLAHAGARGSGRVAQAGARAAPRAGAAGGAIEQWVRGFLLTIDEIARVTYATLVVRKKKRHAPPIAGAPAGPAETAPAPVTAAAFPDEDASEASPATGAPPLTALPDPAWRGSWGLADHIGLFMVVAGLLLLVLAPFATPHEWGTAWATIVDELRPLGPGAAAP
jgi:hypothetical protein